MTPKESEITKISKGTVGNLAAAGPIAIQGFEGSFHQMAARFFYGKETEVRCCSTFREVIDAAKDKKEPMAASWRLKTLLPEASYLITT